MGNTSETAKARIESDVVELLTILLSADGEAKDDGTPSDPIKEVADLLETMDSKTVSQFRRVASRSQLVLNRLQSNRSNKSTAAARHEAFH